MDETDEQQTLPWLRTPHMPIQLQVTGSGARAFCELLGVVEGAYLIVRSGRRDPDALDGLNLQVGDVLVARYVMHGTVAGFRSPVSLILRSPERLAFLDYPKRIERFALRAEQRLECLLPCQVELEGQAVSGLMLDVSASGGLSACARTD